MDTPKILFFLADSVMTNDERIDSFDIGVPVMYRNSKYVLDASEPCDGVAGSVPDCYKKHPTAKEALKKYRSALDERRKNMVEVGGEAPAPEKTEQVETSDPKTEKPTQTTKDQKKDQKNDSGNKNNNAAGAWQSGK